jgi:hypothetical protein
LIESLIDSFGKLERVRSRVTIDQDNSVYYNIDRDQDRSSASDLAYGFSIDKVPSHEGLVRSKFRGFEVSRSQSQGFAGGEGFKVQVSRDIERESSRRVDLSPRRSEVSRFPGRSFWYSKSISRFKLPTPTPLTKTPRRLKLRPKNS